MEPSLPDDALVAAYLRRLGYGEAEAAKYANSRPLAGEKPSQAFLSELARRHVLRIPFENLEQHSGLVGTTEARYARLADPKEAVKRLAFGCRGGVCFDLNPAFVWLLRGLGAKARLSMSWVYGSDGFIPEPSHCVILVDTPEGVLLVDPGFGDPVRIAITMEGKVSDGLATYEVANNEDESTPSYTKVLKRERGTASSSLHLPNLEDNELDNCEAESTILYAFRPEDDLKFDDEDLKNGLASILAPGKTLFSQKKFIVQGLPKGYMVLSERRFRKVENTTTTEEVAIAEGDTEAWESFASKIFAAPLTQIPLDPKVNEAPPRPQAANGYATKGSFNGGGSIGKSQASYGTAVSKAKNLGSISANQIAVGGAGAGGGLGLNRPGFGPKVNHFSGAGGQATKTIAIPEDIRTTWQQVLDDSSPTSWVYCIYTADGKGLEMKNFGSGGLSDFKKEVESNETIAWGGFRCYGVDRRGALECKRPKFVFVQHKPESASAIKKAKQGSHKTDVKDALSGCHLDVVVENLADLEEQSLMDRLQAATGAHKPNGYEFDEGVFLEADFYGLGIGKQCKGETSTGLN
eukprot:TRINITY_DN15457_c0_g1_i1.p1 TRINITY_DN15457_c0_g1~~TRINITY_DN15457_c0_g1_i1.p1  ORF type:complete len:578 (+),score=136.82 TRINITY_DN15457_c0_g1_i1:17-1750(+)